MTTLARLIALTALCALAACATPSAATGPSGPAVVRFDRDAAAVQAALVDACVQRGMPLIEAGATRVVCSIPMSVGQGVITTLALGSPQGATPPQTFVEFLLAPGQPGTLVQGRQWAETMTAFGQTRQLTTMQPEHRQAIEQLLVSLGGRP